MKKSITAFVVALTLSVGALAADFDATAGFCTQVDFDGMTVGKCLNAAAVEGGTTLMPEGVYWLYQGGVGEVSNAVVAAHSGDGKTGNYLKTTLGSDDPLRRLALPLMSGAVASNAWIRTAAYDGIAVDFEARFTYGETNTVIALDDKLTFRFEEQNRADGNGIATNLVIDAGFFNGSFSRIANTTFTVESPVVKPGEWHRITVRVHSSATGILDEAPFATVYIDEQSAVASETSYQASTGYRQDLLTANARTLIDQRRLFAFAQSKGTDSSRYLNALALSGVGEVDGISFTTAIPEFAKDESVFTLKWSGGLKSFDCVVSNKTAELIRKTFTDGEATRQYDFALGAGRYAKVSLANVVCDEAHGYTGFGCAAVAECTVDGASFIYDQAGEAANPIGSVTAKRADGCIKVGGDGYTSFSEAIAAAKQRGEHEIVLGGDVVIAIGSDATTGDGGKLVIADDYGITLNLDGHTLRGQDSLSPTIVVKGSGKLEIIDTQGGGEVLPPANAHADLRAVAIDRRAEPSLIPELTIGGGRFAGEVCVLGKNESTLGKLIVDGGSFTNLDGGATFYLEQYVTNATAYYSCSEGFWSKSLDGYIWCGKGGDSKWSNAKNWRCAAVPALADQVIFPYATNAWTVNYGSLAENPTNYLMDADVTMSGTAEFAHVKVSGSGLFHGSGVMCYTGKLPGTPNLAEDWTGKVQITKITATSLLDKLDGWGKAGSKVEFKGVRGYVKDTRNHTMPYELVLVDAIDGTVTNLAWKNETGYTGSTISFAKLSGGGTLESSKNSRKVNQVLKFEDVSKFYGKLLVAGKRVLLGTASPRSAGEAGSITFSKDVAIFVGGGDTRWQSDSVVFGDTLTVDGKVGDVLVTYTGTTAPVVDAVAVTLLGTGGTTNHCHLTVVGKQVVVAEGPLSSLSSLKINGVSVSAAEAAGQIRNGTTIEIPAGSAVSIQGNEILVNGDVVATIAEYYLVSDNDGTYLVAIDKEKAQPTLSDFSIDGGVVVAESLAGLNYVLQEATSPTGPWTDRETKSGNGGPITFALPSSAEQAIFYRVLVTDTP